jgi:hypothetical protein
MPASLHALGDDGVDPHLGRPLRIGHRADLINDLHPGRVRPRDIGRRITPKGREAGHVLLEAYVNYRIDRKRQMRPVQQDVDAKRPVRERPEAPDLLTQHRRRVRAKRHDAQTAGIAYRGSQLWPGDESHRGREDRHVDSKQVTYWRWSIITSSLRWR